MNDRAGAPQSNNERGAHPLRDALRVRAYDNQIPLSVNLEITKRCNLLCRHCYVAGSADELSTERILNLLGELAAAGTMWVTVTGGEVAVREDWLTIVRAVKERGMIVSVLTNGTLFSDADIEALADLHPARVAVSLYGADEGSHERVTGVPGSFTRSVATLRALVALGVSCRISCVLMYDNVDEVPRLITLAKQIGCDFMFDPTVMPRSDGTTDVTDYRVPSERLREFYLDPTIMSLSREGKVVSSPDDVPTRVAGNCTAGMTLAFIEANGDVLACNGLRPAFGSVTGQPFAEVWHSEEAAEHRRLMQEPLPECSNCGMLDFCMARCPRLALSEHGSIQARSDRACELAAVVKEMRQVLLG
jgi:radical SAM protein with 4Fe4S-binding SPASM domain